jgi:hypothetical protein
MELTGKEKEDFNKFVSDLNELKRILIEHFEGYKEDYVTNEYNKLFDDILSDMLDGNRNCNIYTLDVFRCIEGDSYFDTYFNIPESTYKERCIVLKNYLRIQLLDLFTNDTHRQRN